MSHQISRRSFVRIAGLGSTAVALSNLRGQPAKLPRKPNLVVFIADQLRRGSMACYGAAKVHAPSMNKFAEGATVFDMAYVTQPVCAPSRSSLMTGMWPHMNGVTGNARPLDPRFVCLPEMIADSDYRTGYMGKWHLGDEVFAQHGFQEWVSTEDGYGKRFSAGRDKNAVSDYTKFLQSKGLKPDQKGGYFGRRFGSETSADLRKPKFLETHAIDFIRRHKAEPFILFVSFYEPHPPYFGPWNNDNPLDEIDFEPSATQVLGPELPLRTRLMEENLRKRRGTTLDDYRRTKRKYLGLVTEIDRSVGAVLSELAGSGVDDNTIIALTSDHGDMMGAHRLFGKTFMYHESAAVPYIVRLPQQQRAIRVSQTVSHIDFAPTILDLLGKQPHAQCVGRSLSELVKGNVMAPAPVFLEWNAARKRTKKKPGTKLAAAKDVENALGESTRAVVSPDGWKLCLRDKDKNELYNLRDDPGEMRNLFYDDSRKDVIARLTSDIHDWQQKTGDKLVV
jgi:arylsulfatase A-like enzyme